MDKESIEKYAIHIENEYRIKVGDIVVDIDYAKEEKKFDKCILNIIKHKLKNIK